MDNVIRSRAPTRISFAGGGTDLPEIAKSIGGCVTSVAITKYVYGTLRERNDSKLIISSAFPGKTETEVGEAENIIYNGNLDLVKSVIQELNKDLLGFDITLSTDVPRHSGLGASAAAYAVVIAMFDKFYNLNMTKRDMAELSFVLETEKLKNHVGKQDQYAVVFGGLNFMEFDNTVNVAIRPVEAEKDTISGLERRLVLLRIGERKKTSGSTIREQVTSSLDGFRKTKELGLMARNALEKNDLEKFGDVMASVWKYKKMFGGITTDFIDEIYALALEAGAYGGKVSGAGGGGCAFWFCKSGKKDSVIRSLESRGAKNIPFSFDFEGAKAWVS